MLTSETLDLLTQLERGMTDVIDPSCLKHLSADELISSLHAEYPVLFLEGRVGKKHEIGLAKTVGYEFGIQASQNSPFPFLFMYTVFRKCILATSYENVLSGVTIASSIKACLAGGEERSLIIKMNRAFKLDKTPDGWSTKRVRQRASKLSEELLESKGWNFDVMYPGGKRPMKNGE